MNFKQMQRFCEDGCYECPFGFDSLYTDYDYDELITECQIMYYTEEEIVAEYYKRFGNQDTSWKG